MVSSGKSFDLIIPKADLGDPSAYVSSEFEIIVTQSSSSASTKLSSLVWKVRVTVSAFAGRSISRSSAKKSEPLVALPQTENFIVVSLYFPAS